MKGKSDKHKELQKTAIRWLYNKGCSVYAEEVPTENGVADALGIITRIGQERVYYIEAKQSRSDLLCLKQKSCYRRSVGDKEAMCFFHSVHKFPDLEGKDHKKEMSDSCEECIKLRSQRDTGVDFYYFIISDNIKIEDTLYPEWGVINEKGEVIRKAKRQKREKAVDKLVISIAHILVYKVFGKMYLLVNTPSPKEERIQ